MILIQPWEKSLIRPIEKAIQTSELGINPSNDGTVIRLVFPELTEDRRKELAKDVKKKGDGAKVAIRNIRRDANEAFKKMEKKKIPSEINYDDIESLRLEARQKLKALKPVSVGQASRISGVSPADISVLVVYLEQWKYHHPDNL